MNQINVFLPYSEQIEKIAGTFQSDAIKQIYILSNEPVPETKLPVIQTDNMFSTDTVRKIASCSDSDYTLIYTKDKELLLGQYALERFINIAQSSGAGLVYSDFYQRINNVQKPIPVIDYQAGSVRDDFNFGSILFYNAKALKTAAAEMKKNYTYAGLYDLRLKVSEKYPLLRINEFLYTENETDTRKSGEKQFDYVDPKNRTVQQEMEEACTEHLKKTGAYLAPRFHTVSFEDETFTSEASVLIPVKNRAKTIEDAIKSVLMQKTDFPFTLLIVDNYSTDGTSEIIKKYAEKDNRVIHIIPDRKDLGIGGCWNAGVDHAACGKFVVQLDSDDVYQDENTLQCIINAFYEQQCPMVIGSYTMTNFDMETIPPGLIDHREWTPENGRNNALRINGLGAPRAFYTPLLRKLKVPNTSYGEDYALGLRISREYQIGRIYNSIYRCRRWDENSDAALEIEKINAHNLYKDKLRTIEIKARQLLNVPIRHAKLVI